MKQNIKEKFDIAFNNFFNEKRTPGCDKYYDLIPALVMFDQGKSDDINKPLLTEIRNHIKTCIFCEHEYNIVYDEMNLELSAKEKDFIKKLITSEKPEKKKKQVKALEKIGKTISDTVSGLSLNPFQHLGSISPAFASTDTEYYIIRDQLLESILFSLAKGEEPDSYTVILKAAEGYLEGYYSIVQGERTVLITLEAWDDETVISGDFKGPITKQKLDYYRHKDRLTSKQILKKIKERRKK